MVLHCKCKQNVFQNGTASRLKKVIIYSRQNKPSVLSLLVFSLADLSLSATEDKLIIKLYL